MAVVVPSSAKTRGWQKLLVILGLAIILIAVVLEIIALDSHPTMVVTTNPAVKARPSTSAEPSISASPAVSASPASTTTRNAPAPPDASLITALAGVGGVLVLAGAFFSRISSITVDGATITFAQAEALTNKIAAVTTADPAKKDRMYKYAVGRLSSAAPIQVRASRTRSRVGPRAIVNIPVAPVLTDDALDALVTEADSAS